MSKEQFYGSSSKISVVGATLWFVEQHSMSKEQFYGSSSKFSIVGATLWFVKQLQCRWSNFMVQGAISMSMEQFYGSSSNSNGIKYTKKCCQSSYLLATLLRPPTQSTIHATFSTLLFRCLNFMPK